MNETRVRISAMLLTVVASLCLASCSQPEEAAKGEIAKVPVEAGMKYYIGGPVLAQDEFGHARIKSYEGQVLTPPSRGVVIGYKELPDGEFESKTWVMGKQSTYTKGFVGEDGLQWPTYREIYSNGKVSQRQWTSYSEDRKNVTIKSEALDLDTGKVLQSKTFDATVRPNPGKEQFADDPFFDDDEDAGDGDGGEGAGDGEQ